MVSPLLLNRSFYRREEKVMKIKPMLARFQSTIGRDDLTEQMVLISEPKISIEKQVQSAPSLNFIVGYNSSCNSHTALDIALCIAHQTQLATKIQVGVKAVFVVENNQNNHYQADDFTIEINQCSVEYISKDSSNSLTPVLTESKIERQTLITIEQADLVLAQARSLAQEWRSDFQAYLRFGCIATELKKVVVSEGADVLLLGCKSVNHPIIQSLGYNFPCAVLGIPDVMGEI
jgi:hypothetical protein